MKRAFSFTAVALILAGPACAANTPKPSVVPSEFQWVRTMDVEGYVQRDPKKMGAQHLRFHLRYLDPDVNAFVGMQWDLDHFNRPLALGDPDDPSFGHYLWTAGANIGIVHKKTAWELDLMGATAAGRLGPALAVVADHHFNPHWMYRGRLQGDFFIGDGIADIDQEFSWMPKKFWSITAGYRIFSSLHMGRSGPHIGLSYSFDSPKPLIYFPEFGVTPPTENCAMFHPL